MPQAYSSTADALARRRAGIHALCKRMGLDDDTRRDMLERIAGVRSTKQLDLRGAGRVLDHLNRAAGKAPRPSAGRAPNTLARNARLQKIEALLADMGLPWSYAETIGKRQSPVTAGARVERLEWLNERALTAVIAALVREHKKRAAVVWADLVSCAKRRGLAGDAFTAWFAATVARPGMHTAAHEPRETIQTLTRLKAMLG